MDRDQLLRRIVTAWRAFGQACHGLSDAALQEPGVVGDWSVKDLLGHLATWEEEALAALPVIMRGGRTVRYVAYGGIDAFNDGRWQQYREMQLADVHRRSSETHARLVAFLGTVPDRHFDTETRFRRRLRLDAYRHYPEHTLQVVRWRKTKGL